MNKIELNNEDEELLEVLSRIDDEEDKNIIMSYIENHRIKKRIE